VWHSPFVFVAACLDPYSTVCAFTLSPPFSALLGVRNNSPPLFVLMRNKWLSSTLNKIDILFANDLILMKPDYKVYL